MKLHKGLNHMFGATIVALLLQSSATAQVLRTTPPPVTTAAPPPTNSTSQPTTSRTATPGTAAASTSNTAALAKIHADMAPYAGQFQTRAMPEVKNPAALSSPMETTLKAQQQTVQSGGMQPMSAPGVPPRNIGAAQMPSSVLCPPNTIGIRTVAQKTTGVVFTPASGKNVYVITGCGFGTTPGRIYLSAGASGFPAHSGKITLTPQTPSAWTNQTITADVDPTVVGELDQNNVSIIVVNSSGQQAQMNGNAFYATRANIKLATLPRTAVCVTFPGGNYPHDCEPIVGDSTFVSPPSDYGLDAGTAGVWREGVALQPGMTPSDYYTVKLNPGFELYSAVLNVLYPKQTSQGTQSIIYGASGRIINGNTIQIAPVPIFQWPGTGMPISFYSVAIWVQGPAGITNALAANQ